MIKGRVYKTELKRKRNRREKIKKLRIKYINAKSEEEKKKIIEKALKVNPFLTEETFLSPIIKK